VVRFARSQSDSAVVFASSCDQLRRGFDAATQGEQRRSFLFNVPATLSPAAKQLYRDELEQLGHFLEQLGGRAPNSTELWRELLRAGQARQHLLDLAPVCSSRTFAEAVARFHRDGGLHPAIVEQRNGRVPLALVGGPFLAHHWPLLDEIEMAGGQVVLNATENGERSLCPAFAPEASNLDAFEVMASGHFENIVDVFQRPNTRLYSWMKARLGPRHVRGVILWHFTGCDLWRAEADTLRESFRLPVLVLEANEQKEAQPRDINRVQAFLEALK
jgi:hypothetical protein